MSNIRIIRKSLGMTQDELAQKVGVSQSLIHSIESGSRVGSLKTLKAIAACLGVKLSDIIGE